jgi:hypothetical protein
MTDASEAATGRDPRLRTSWRPGSRRAFAYHFNELLTVKGGYLELVAVDGPDPEFATELGAAQSRLESLSREAVAAGYLDEEQAAVLVGSDVTTASRLNKATIWDFDTDPAFAGRGSPDWNMEPDWSMDWPAATLNDEERPNRR